MDNVRNTVRCQRCNLVQYQTKNGHCRRCSADLQLVEGFKLPEPEPIVLNQSKTKVETRLVFNKFNFGKAIAFWRERRGWTQAQFVTRARQMQWRLSRSYLSRVESGQMSFGYDYANLAFECLEITPEEFFNHVETDWFVSEVSEMVQSVSPEYRNVILNTIKSLLSQDNQIDHREEVRSVVSNFNIPYQQFTRGRQRRTEACQ
jgi:transcriptional regulator with XRE-family HTH domain